MDVYEAISVRKSVRAFKGKEVPGDVITRLLGAAQRAPSANNSQEWRFVVVRNPETREKISQAARNGNPLFFHPGIIAPIQDMYQVSLYISKGPITEARRTVMSVNHEFLPYTKPVAL